VREKHKSFAHLTIAYIMNHFNTSGQQKNHIPFGM